MMLKMNQLSGMNCHYIHYSIDYFLDAMVREGLTNIEIWGAAPHYFADYFTESMVRSLGRKIAQRGLCLICLTPEQVTYPINIASGEPYLRKRSIKNYLRALEHAALLNAPMMLLTPGYGNLDESREAAWHRSADAIATLARRAEDLGIRLALEHLSPASSNLINTAQDLRRMLDEVDSPNLKAMFDIGQVNIVGQTPADYFRLLGSDIIHIHLVDGVPGGHLALGDGNIPLMENLQEIAQAGYQGFFSMEIADRRYFDAPRRADVQSIQKYKALLRALGETEASS